MKNICISRSLSSLDFRYLPCLQRSVNAMAELLSISPLSRSLSLPRTPDSSAQHHLPLARICPSPLSSCAPAPSTSCVSGLSSTHLLWQSAVVRRPVLVRVRADEGADGGSSRRRWPSAAAARWGRHGGGHGSSGRSGAPPLRVRAPPPPCPCSRRPVLAGGGG